MYAQRKFQNKKTPCYKKRLIIALLAALLVSGVVATLEFTDTTEFFHKADRSLATLPTTPNRTSGPTTKGEPKDGQKPTTGGTPKEADSPSNTSSAPLREPSGTFVSNHHPNLDSSPNPNQIQSVCVTTPGATCTIVFTKNNEIRQLPPQVTDGEGAAYWTWKLQDIGLTEGSWKVQAKAQLGTQQKVADDAMKLEIES